MSEFFLELFSEEIPAGLQKNLREKIFEDFKNLFEEKSIRSKKNFSFSTHNISSSFLRVGDWKVSFGFNCFPFDSTDFCITGRYQ